MKPFERLRRVVVAMALGFGALALPSKARADAASIAVVETRAAGVQAASAEAVTRQLYATVGRLGYRTVPAKATAAATPMAPTPYTARELLGVAETAHADRAVGATLGAEGGRYVITLTLANADRTGPFDAHDTADAASLEATTDRLTRTLLPELAPPETHALPEAIPGKEQTGFRLAAQTEGAFGLGKRFFYNHLAGARLDYDFSNDFSFGGYLGYVNLKGKDGRVSNVLPYAQAEYRLRISDAVWIPFRFGSGYLPKNGPFLRVAAGLMFPLGESTRLGFDLLAPTVWIVRNAAVFSMDVAAEVSIGF